ncbi:MAG: hypothetical protein ACLFSB_00470 [Chitinispirillaceae bacterium]
MLIVAFTACSYAMTAGDREKYEAKGLSQVEWQMIQDAQMPEEKVDELLKAGISISEYFDYPWLALRISEREYIKKRKAGMLDADIEAYSNKMKVSDLAVIQNFFLPGFYQFKRNQKLKAFTMSGLTVGFLGLTAILSVKKDGFMPEPLFLMIPVMLWSSIDIGLQIRKVRNPDATRFSNSSLKDNTIEFVFSAPIYPVNEK